MVKERRPVINRTPTIFVISVLTVLATVDHAFGQTCAPAPAGLVSWWPGEGSADDVADGNPGTLQNGASFTVGHVGQGFSLDGVDDYVHVPDAENLDGMARLTVDAWVKFDALPAGKWQMIVAKGAAVGFGSNSFVLWFAGDNLRLQAAVESPSGLNTVSAPDDVIVPGTFYHVAVTYDGSSIKMYLNGVFKQSAGLNGAVRDTTYPVLIGRRSGTGVDGKGDVLIGVIDEVDVYERALTDAEIQAIYNAGSAGKCPFTPQQRITLLASQIDVLIATGVLNRGQGNALLVKLDAAMQQLDLGNVNAATNELQAFINQVQAYISAGVLSPSEAKPVLIAAQAIVNMLAV